MAGVRTNATAERVELIFDCHDASEATTLAGIINDTLIASGSLGSYRDGFVITPVDTVLTVIVPHQHLTNTHLMELFIEGIIRDQVVPVVQSPRSVIVKGIIPEPR